jgi:2-methylcitrate dehydratase PrpD
MATPTRTLAAFASTLSYEAIPTGVREATKQYLLDTIGCGIYGSQTPWAKTLNQLIVEQGGRPEATLWLQVSGTSQYGGARAGGDDAQL